MDGKELHSLLHAFIEKGTDDGFNPFNAIVEHGQRFNCSPPHFVLLY